MIHVNTIHSVRKKGCNKRRETHLLLAPSPSSTTSSLVPSSSPYRLIESNSVQLSASLLLLLVGTLTSVCAAGSDASHARINNLQQKCDRMFSSKPGTAKNGSFTSPSFQNNANHSRQCIYTFQAAENERVEVTFTSFNLRGAHPEYVSNTKNTPKRGERKKENKKTCPFFLPHHTLPDVFDEGSKFLSSCPSFLVLPFCACSFLPAFLSTSPDTYIARDSVPNDFPDKCSRRENALFLLNPSELRPDRIRLESAGKRKHLPLISIFC